MPDRVKALRELIEALDGLRIGRYSNIDKLERLINELGLRLPFSWDEVKQDIRAILALPTTSPDYFRIERLDRWAGRLTRINLALLVLSIGAFLARSWLSSVVLDIAALALVTSALVIVNLAYSLKAYVSLRVEAIYAAKVDELEKLGGRIKRVVEYLLRLLRRELKTEGYDIEAFTLKLWLPDYSGIRIVKKPSRFSPRYVVRLA